MAMINGLGLGGQRGRRQGETGVEHVRIQRPLHRILAFTRRSIDDIVNDPIARNEVLGYYRLHKQIERGCEVVELEQQWNALGR